MRENKCPRKVIRTVPGRELSPKSYHTFLVWRTTGIAFIISFGKRTFSGHATRCTTVTHECRVFRAISEREPARMDIALYVRTRAYRYLRRTFANSDTKIIINHVWPTDRYSNKRPGKPHVRALTYYHRVYKRINRFYSHQSRLVVRIYIYIYNK